MRPQSAGPRPWFDQRESRPAEETRPRALWTGSLEGPPLSVCSLLFQLAPVSCQCLPATTCRGPEFTLIIPLCLSYLCNLLVLKVYAGQARGYSLPLVRISKGMGGGLEKHPKFFDFRLGLESCLRVVVWGEVLGKRGDGTKTRAWVQTQTHVSGSSFHLFFEARVHFLSCKLRPNLWSDSAHQES